MMFWMTSKVFQNDFLTNEKDNDILKAQYVIVSSRIRVRDRNMENIIVGNVLFPDHRVMAALTDEDLRDRYEAQLDDNIAFLCSLVKGSIEENFNIIFICTKNENQLHYLQYLADYIYMYFGYPVYEYHLYSIGASRLLSYDKRKIVKKCDETLDHVKSKQYKKMSGTKEGRKLIMKDYKEKSKDELKKILKKNNLYKKGMDKEDMLDMIEAFL